jgi:cation:H+ antiporter
MLLADGRLGWMEGAALLMAAVGYTGLVLHKARQDMPGSGDEAESEAASPARRALLWRDVLYVAVGLVMLVAGARLLVSGATAIALAAGLSEAVIGLTIVAAGTSLPELATSLLAALRGQSDIALGNVIGSNIYNVLGILGVSSLVHPLVSVGIGTVDLAVMLSLSVLLLPLLWTGFRLSRWEGALLLAIYVGYTTYLLSA